MLLSSVEAPKTGRRSDWIGGQGGGTRGKRVGALSTFWRNSEVRKENIVFWRQNDNIGKYRNCVCNLRNYDIILFFRYGSLF
jgi:hypothetical protein